MIDGRSIANVGAVVSVGGSVVDVRFDERLTPTQGLARGITVEDTGGRCREGEELHRALKEAGCSGTL